jgi:hypothetical protein
VKILQALLLILAATLCSCASGEGILPVGGPADTTAPRILSSTPLSGTTNFRGDQIEIEFDEYLRESNVAASVVITPIPRTLPRFDWSGTTLQIEFAEPLIPDRTYTVTVGSAVTDEAGNRLGQPFTLRFSTGDEIDSGRIAGEVVGKSKSNAYVYAWLTPRDTAGYDAGFRPDTLFPDFVAPIGDDGRFSLEGLPVGRFRLLAVADQFGDGRYTPGEDAYGLTVGDVVISSQTEPVVGIRFRLRSAPEDIIPPQLYSATSINRGRTELRFSEPIDSASLRTEAFTVTADGGSPVRVRSLWRLSTNALVVNLMHDELPAGSQATLQATGLRDTSGNGMIDTASRATYTVIDQPDTSPPLLLQISVDSLHRYIFPDSIRLGFDEAVQITETDGAIAMRDSSGTLVKYRLERISPVEFLARPLDTIFSTSRASIEIALGRFSDETGNRRDSLLRFPVPIAPMRQSGALEGSIQDSAAPNALHVLVLRETQTGRTVIRRDLKQGRWSFPSIAEGEYEVLAFRDDNHDGNYDYGELIPWHPAETFVAWRGTVRVRPRWTTNKVDLVFPH